jgi:hypothetical protein
MQAEVKKNKKIGKRRKIEKKMISGHKKRSWTGKNGLGPNLITEYETLKIGPDLRLCNNSAM